MKWTEEEIKRFIEYFGKSLPDPTHYPRVFKHYVKLWEYLNRDRDS